MGLQDVVRADIAAVFINKDGFAKEHVIDGEQITCIIDEDKASANKVDGVYDVRRHLFVSEADLGYRPIPKQKMNVDGNHFDVVDCVGEDLLEVILGGYDS